MYEAVLSIALRHEYYPSGFCPVSLAPTAETARLLARRGILFRRQKANSWLLVAQNALAEPDFLHFNLTAGSDTLYYVTRAWKENPAVRVEAASAPKVWQTLTVDVQYLAENGQAEITVEAESEEKYLEFLCIPRFSGADIPLRMAEEKRRIQVKESPKKATLPDGTEARCFVTAEKVKLRLNSGIKMLLWEVRENGERLIGNAIDSPAPSQPSLRSPRDTVTRFYYY
ncbi:MAG: hypothetical protein LBF55_04235 [Prevotellaceae bacterium]|jgi:hypothetical protein|nr:hypothetical protein [Prevotellaceae bacterium]